MLPLGISRTIDTIHIPIFGQSYYIFLFPECLTILCIEIEVRY